MGKIRTIWSFSRLSGTFSVSSSASWGEMKKWICVVVSVEFWKWQAGQESPPPFSPLWSWRKLMKSVRMKKTRRKLMLRPTRRLSNVSIAV